MTCFVIDTSVLIHLEDNYPRDILPTLWDEIYKLFEEGKIFSINIVYKELKDSDELWKDYKDCFREIRPEETEAVNNILQDSRFEVFKRHGLGKENWADPFLIACAMVDEDVVVVSEENLNRNPQRKIQYVCNELNLSYMNFLQFLRAANVKV